MLFNIFITKLCKCLYIDHEVEWNVIQLIIWSITFSKKRGVLRRAYNKSVVVCYLQERQAAVCRCDIVITSAVRLNLADVIQAGCATLWNLCLPLLQPKLRHQVHRYLLSAVEALENINRLADLLHTTIWTPFSPKLGLALCWIWKIVVFVTNFQKTITVWASVEEWK